MLAIKKEFDAWQPAGHTGTFRANQLAMATGYASLKIMRNENLAQNAKERGVLNQRTTRIKQRIPMYR